MIVFALQYLPQFAKCNFQVTDRAAEYDEKLVQKIESLGFKIKSAHPLVVCKRSCSGDDIKKLIDVIDQAFEPKLGEDFEIIESFRALNLNDEESLSAEENSSKSLRISSLCNQPTSSLLIEPALQTQTSSAFSAEVCLEEDRCDPYSQKDIPTKDLVSLHRPISSDYAKVASCEKQPVDSNVFEIGAAEYGQISGDKAESVSTQPQYESQSSHEIQAILVAKGSRDCTEMPSSVTHTDTSIAHLATGEDGSGNIDARNSPLTSLEREITATSSEAPGQNKPTIDMQKAVADKRKRDSDEYQAPDNTTKSQTGSVVGMHKTTLLRNDEEGKLYRDGRNTDIDERKGKYADEEEFYDCPDTIPLPQDQLGSGKHTTSFDEGGLGQDQRHRNGNSYKHGLQKACVPQSMPNQQGNHGPAHEMRQQITPQTVAERSCSRNCPSVREKLPLLIQNQMKDQEENTRENECPGLSKTSFSQSTKEKSAKKTMTSSENSETKVDLERARLNRTDTGLGNEIRDKMAGSVDIVRPGVICQHYPPASRSDERFHAHDKPHKERPSTSEERFTAHPMSFHLPSLSKSNHTFSENHAIGSICQDARQQEQSSTVDGSTLTKVMLDSQMRTKTIYPDLSEFTGTRVGYSANNRVVMHRPHTESLSETSGRNERSDIKTAAFTCAVDELAIDSNGAKSGTSSWNKGFPDTALDERKDFGERYKPVVSDRDSSRDNFGGDSKHEERERELSRKIFGGQLKDREHSRDGREYIKDEHGAGLDEREYSTEQYRSGSSENNDFAGGLKDREHSRDYHGARLGGREYTKDEHKAGLDEREYSTEQYRSGSSENNDFAGGLKDREHSRDYHGARLGGREYTKDEHGAGLDEREYSTEQYMSGSSENNDFAGGLKDREHSRDYHGARLGGREYTKDDHKAGLDEREYSTEQYRSGSSENNDFAGGLKDREHSRDYHGARLGGREYTKDEHKAGLDEREYSTEQYRSGSGGEITYDFPMHDIGTSYTPSSKSMHWSQSRAEDNVDREVRETIQYPPGTDILLLRYATLLPSKMQYPEVRISLDKNQSLMVLDGKASEVLKVKEKMTEILITQESHDEQKSHAAPSQGSSRGSTNNPRRDEYKTTYYESYQNPSHRGRGESEDRRNYGSSVDRQQPWAKEMFTTRSGIRVRVKNTDITKLAVDAIVNAANSRLNHGGGVAKAISNKAGAELQKECYKFTKGERKIPVGGIFVSTAGNLPSKHVIHAVGPRWRDYGETKREECARDLRRTVLRCLVEANQRGCCSIAIPSISAGELLHDYNFYIYVHIYIYIYIYIYLVR